MRVLLTGAFGNLGKSTIIALHEANHEITCFDLLSRKNKRKEAKLQKIYTFRTIWGDILDVDCVAQTIENKDCIIHLAGITPPATEHNPDLAYQINVQGTKNVVIESLKQKKLPRIIFSSSFTVYGPQHPDSPPRNKDHPLNPVDIYTKNKVEIEKLIQQSGLPWTICRIAATPSLSITGNEFGLLYEIPMEQKIEFAHTYDVGKALANCLQAETDGKILLIGGGKDEQMTNRVLLTKYFETLGINMLPEAVFKEPEHDEDWYYTNWLDTEESQKLLKYQNHSLDDYLHEIRKQMGITRLFTVLFRPLIRKILIKRSPYYKINLKKKKEKKSAS